MDKVLVGGQYRYKKGFSQRAVVVEEVTDEKVGVRDGSGKASAMMLRSFLSNYALIEKTNGALHRSVSGTSVSGYSVPPQQISFAIEYVTPAMAERWLASRQETNRNIRAAVVARYAADMAADRWVLTHQGIAFGDDEKLFDGQHRLSAVVKSGASVWLVVARYSAAEAQAAKLATDTGRLRNIGCVGEVSGTFARGKGTAIAAIVAGMMVLEKNPGLGSAHQVVGYYTEHRRAVDWALTTLRGREFNQAIRAAFAFAYEVEPEKVDELATACVEKVGYESGDAAHVFIRQSADGTFRYGVRADRSVVMAKVLRVIKSHLLGQQPPGRLHASQEVVDWFASRRKQAGK